MYMYVLTVNRELNRACQPKKPFILNHRIRHKIIKNKLRILEILNGSDWSLEILVLYHQTDHALQPIRNSVSKIQIFKCSEKNTLVVKQSLAGAHISLFHSINTLLKVFYHVLTSNYFV